jgi:hypothetical protein
LRLEKRVRFSAECGSRTVPFPWLTVASNLCVMVCPRRLSLGLTLASIGAGALGCGGMARGPSRGGEVVTCPSGSANPGAEIRTMNCDTVVEFDAQNIEASIDVKNLMSAGVKNAAVVLREVSEAAEESQIQFSQMCELYNGCGLTTAEYRDRLDAGQAHFRAVREKVDLLRAAEGNPEALRHAFAALYETAIPKSAGDILSMEFSAIGAGPSGTSRVLPSGETLHTGDPIVFGLKVSRKSYAYLFQRKSQGQIEVLFPSASIPGLTNPVAPGTLVRVPPDGQVFRLDDKDLGAETVYVAVSEKPLTDLEAALAQVATNPAGGTKGVEIAMVDLFDAGAPECGKTRGLEVSAPKGCGSMTRGLTTSPAPSSTAPAASVSGQAVPGDDVILQVFQFQHAP